MPEVRPGQVYEWVRYAGSGREMPIEERIQSRFVIEKGPFLCGDGTKLWEHSDGGRCAVEFWLEKGFVRIYSQSSLNLPREEYVPSKYFVVGSRISFIVTGGKRYNGLVVKASGNTYTLRDWHSYEYWTVVHVKGDNYTFSGDGVRDAWVNQVMTDLSL